AVMSNDCSSGAKPFCSIFTACVPMGRPGTSTGVTPRPTPPTGAVAPAGGGSTCTDPSTATGATVVGGAAVGVGFATRVVGPGVGDGVACRFLISAKPRPTAPTER